jgi:predicted Rossmann fold nucleotide-binding protein DprA/Smf involved in DNA uptake
MTHDTDQLLAAISSRIAAANDEISRLRAARAALLVEGRVPHAVTDRTAPMRGRERGNSTPARWRSSPPAQRRRVVSADELERLLADSDNGLSATAIAGQAKVSTAQVSARLRELERAGQVLATGERRTRRWRLLTDEDRVARRTAELELAGTSKSNLAADTA